MENNETTKTSTVEDKTRSNLNIKLFITYALTLFMLFLFFYPILTRASAGASYYIFTFTIFFLFASFALTLNLEVGFLGIPNFGKVAFIAIGGYSYAIFTEAMAKRYEHGDPIFFGLLEFRGSYLVIMGLLFATIITGFFGALLTLPTIRLREDFLAIVTIVAGEIVRYVANNEELFKTFSGFTVANPVRSKYNPDTTMTGFWLGSTEFVILLVFVIGSLLYYQVMVRSVPTELPYLANLRFQRLVTYNILGSIVIIFLEFFKVFGTPSVGMHFLLIFNITILILYKTYWKNSFNFVVISGLLGLFATISFIFGSIDQAIVIEEKKIDDIIGVDASLWTLITGVIILGVFSLLIYRENESPGIKNYVSTRFPSLQIQKINVKTNDTSKVFYGMIGLGTIATLISIILSFGSDGLARGFFLSPSDYIISMLVLYFTWRLIEHQDIVNRDEFTDETLNMFLSVTIITLFSVSINTLLGPQSVGLHLFMAFYLIVTFIYLKKWFSKFNFSIINATFMAFTSFSFFLGQFTNSLNLRKITIQDQTIIKPVDWFSCLYTLFTMLVIYFIIEELYNSPFGRNLKAIREDEISAISVGKDVFDYRLKALVIASALTGFAGAVNAQIILIVSPKQYEPVITFTIYIMLIIGGTGNNKGAIFGAFVIQLLFSITRGTIFADSEIFYPSIDRMIVNALSGNFGYVNSTRQIDAENLGLIIVGIMLILFLIYSPDGLLPEKKKDNQRFYELANYYEGREVEDDALALILSRFVSEEEQTEDWIL